MKFLIFLSFVLITNLTYGQVTFTVDGFSNDIFGKIYISDTAQVFSKGWVAILDKKTRKQLIKVSSDELTFDLHDGKVLANIQESPYGEQSQIIYKDFNFDGKNDLAIMDGQNSGYHLPSYKIYLSTPDGFKFSPDFTRLAQEYCGMFDLDPKAKKINTMTKSGCCWHQSTEFIVENNKPKAVKITEDDLTNLPYNVYSEQIWNGKKMVKSTTKTIDLTADGVKPVLILHIDENKKDLVLFNINDRTLNYAVINKNKTVEFSYPVETVYQNPDFIFNSKQNTLTFKNNNATYKIIDKGNDIKVEIGLNGKTYTWVGNIHTKKGSMSDLLTTKLDNVVIN